MIDGGKKYPTCFGVLESVFPEGTDGFRKTPERCFPCVYKTDCMRSAMGGSGGLKVREEFIDRAYTSGMMNFLERWARKKDLQRRKKEMKNTEEKP